MSLFHDSVIKKSKGYNVTYDPALKVDFKRNQPKGVYMKLDPRINWASGRFDGQHVSGTTSLHTSLSK